MLLPLSSTLYFALTVSLFLGYRSVPLKNAYGEEFELSSLLVFLDMYMVSSIQACSVYAVRRALSP